MRFPLTAFVLVCTVLIAIPLPAQSPNGNINGLISDPSGAAVADAEVVAVNDVTRVPYATKTNNEGIYSLPNLPPGPYGVQVSKIGFKTLIKRDITLNVQDSLSLNFTLLVGAFHEIVTVQGGAPMVNTESAAVSTVVDQAYVKNMPLNGRSFQDLILLTPGIVTQSPQSGSAVGQTGEFSINGQRPEENYYTVDGVSANVGATAGFNMYYNSGASGSLPGSTALGTTQALVSVDDLQEFRVQSSTYSAEYGRNPGGQLAFETKSGTNQWHGSGYDYLRNGIFDANDWFNDYYGLHAPDLRQNDFGGTLGGPVEAPGVYQGHDRTFFFLSYEGLRLAAPQAATVTYVPDTALRAASPTALRAALDAFPTPNGPDLGGGIAENIASWSNPAALDSASARFDHAVSNRLKLFFRFSDTRSDSTSRGTNYGDVPTVQIVLNNELRTYTAGATGVFSNRLNDDFRINYSSNNVSNPFVISSLGGSTPVNLAQLTGLPAKADIAIVLSYGGYSPLLEQQEQFGSQRQWNFVDTVALSFGRHQLKFGFDYRSLAPVAIVANPSLYYYYFSDSAVEANNPFTSPATYGSAYPLYRNISVFAQDEWRLTRRLSISAGLRWEVNPAPSVTQGLNPYTIQGSTPEAWTLAPQGTPLWKTTWFNLAPRLGAAYILHNGHGWETVARGGGGVFFDTGQQVGSQGFNGPGFDAYGNFLPGLFPTVPSIPTIVNPPVPPFGFAYGFAPHLQLPYTLQWSASLEQALGGEQSLSVTSVGAHASRLLRENAIVPPNNPILVSGGNFYFYDNGLTSDYDSLQIQYRRRLTQGLSALASYTWSHCMDYGSQNYYYGYYQRGDCDFDVRHNLSAAFSFDFPNVGHGRLLHATMYHWGLDNRFTARTSFPVTLNGSTAVDPQSGKQYYEGLNFVAGQPVYIYGAQCFAIYAALYGNGSPCPGRRAINPNAFISVISGYGDASRNFARGFGAWQMDSALRREFPIYDNLKLQFRAEFFNIFNHPNFGTVNPYIGQRAFGQATATLASSLGTLSPLYQMGGPRSIQFALKLTF